MIRNVLARICAGVFLLGSGAYAQDFPNRPVRLIVASPPGGGTDLIARGIGKKLAEKWGQSVVIDNRAGGDGAIGAGVAARSAPDGYTLLMIISTHTVLPSLKTSVPYDMAQDFAPVILLAEAPNLIVVHPSLPVKSVTELIALAKKQPGKLNYAGPGTGGPAHLAAELFNRLAGTTMTHIPYKGTGPALIDLIGGHLSLMFPTMSGAMVHVRTGKLRALAVTSEKRSPAVPELPTVMESGLKGYVFVSWFGLVTRAGTPKPVVDKLFADTAAVLGTEEMKVLLDGAGTQAAARDPVAFAAYIDAELKKWSRVVADAQLKIAD